MSIFSKLNPFTPVIEKAGDIIDKFVVDKDKAIEAKAKLQTMDLSNAKTALEAQVAIVVAETQGGWIQRNWRPLTMLCFVFIIMWNHWISVVFSLPSTPIPPQMWELIKLGMGGYVVGRSVEKGIKLYKEK